MPDQLIYGLLYPAFLGTFIYAIFEHPPIFTGVWSSDKHLPWGILFAAYFALQFVRLGASRTDKAYWLADVGELFVLVWLFASLGYADEGPRAETLPSGQAQWLMIAAVIFPLCKRICTKDFGGSGIFFAGLSLLAIGVLGFWKASCVSQGTAFMGLTILMVIYFGLIIAIDREWCKRPEEMSFWKRFRQLWREG